MSTLAEKMETVRAADGGKARQSIEHLRNRFGVQPEAYEKDPFKIVVKGPFQTEWWVRVSRGWYELECAVRRGDE